MYMYNTYMCIYLHIHVYTCVYIYSTYIYIHISIYIFICIWCNSPACFR